MELDWTSKSQRKQIGEELREFGISFHQPLSTTNSNSFLQLYHALDRSVPLLSTRLFPSNLQKLFLGEISRHITQLCIEALLSKLQFLNSTMGSKTNVAVFLECLGHHPKDFLIGDSEKEVWTIQESVFVSEPHTLTFSTSSSRRMYGEVLGEDSSSESQMVEHQETSSST